MRKQNKIISLILVVALLFSMLIFTVPGAAAAEGEGTDTFAPSATYVKTDDDATIFSAIKSDVSGNVLCLDMTNFNGLDDKGVLMGATSGIVTDTATGEKYLEVLPGDEGANTYIIASPVQSGGVVVSKGDVNQYYVLDMDVAFYSAPSAFGYYAVCRDGSGLFGANVNGGGAFTTTVGALELGVFNHFTTVLDFDNNLAYTFINGEYVNTTSNGVYGASGAAKYEGTTMKFEQFRLFSSNVSSFLVDNVSVRKATDIATMATALSSQDITAWSEDVSADAEHNTVPAFATVDGEEVYSVTALEAALSGGVLPAKVSLLRDLPGEVTVSRDAVIETNGCTANLVAGTDVSLSVNGTVKTFDAPWTASYTAANAASFALKDDNIPGNRATANTSGLSNWNNDAVKAEMITPAGSSDSFPAVTAVANKATGNHFVNVAFNAFNVDFTNYYVFDMDVASNSGVLDLLNVAFVIRGAAGVSAPYDMGTGYLSSYMEADGRWHHLTVVGDTAANKMYVFIDGVLVDNTKKAYESANKVESEIPSLNGIRLNFQGTATFNVGDMLAFDNVGIRNVASTDTALAAALAAGNISGWTGAVTAPERDTLPVIATVDGTPVYSALELSGVLMGNDVKNVEFYADMPAAVEVNCDAVINTNGCNVNLVAGNGVTSTQEGNVYTFDAPYVQSTVYSDRVLAANKTVVTNEIIGNVAGTIFEGAAQWNVIDADDGYVHLATNTITGDKYLYHDGSYALASGNAAANNSYFELQTMTSIPYSTTEKVYMVYDFDYAQLSAGTVATMMIPRLNGSTALWGGNNIAASAAASSYPMGEFVHLTYVYDVMANKCYIFANGVLYSNTGTWTSADNFAKFTTGTSVRFDGLRFGSNSTANFAIDNFAVRKVTEAVGSSATGSMNAAFAAADIKLWTGAITAPSSEIAPIAVVDGEYVGSAASLTAMLNGRKVKNVEILCDVAEAITVNCDAVVETNGLSVTLNPGTGVTVTTEGTVKTFDAPWKASASEVKNPSNNDILAGVGIGETVNYGGSGNYTDDTVMPYLVTDVNTGNQWLEIRPGATMTTGTTHNHFNFQVAGSKTVYDSSKALVYAFDYYAPNDNNAELYFGVITRNSTGGNIGGTGWYPARLGFTEGEWVRVIVISDVQNNISYIYVNGVRVGTHSNGVHNQTAFAEGSYFEGIRVNVNTRAKMTADMTTGIDNFYIDVNCTDAWVNANLGAATLDGWDNAPSYKLPEIPSIATVDGVEYNNVAAIEQALSVGKNHAVSLDRAFSGSIVSASTATVTTNGLANFITPASGFGAQDNGDGTVSIVVETRYGTVTVKINGNDAISAYLLYGTDFAEYLNLNNAYAFNVIADDNGQIYTGANWDKAPSVVAGDVVYNVTATALEDDILVLNTADGSVVSGIATLYSALTGGSSSNDWTIFVNSDVELNQVTLNGAKTVYLAGHTVNVGVNNTAQHAMTGGSYTKDITFIGGSVVDTVRTNTQSIFYGGYDYASVFKLLNCDVFAVANVIGLRGGNATVENCNLTVLESLNSYAFQIGEHYNGNSTPAKITLNLINSNIRYNHFTVGRTHFFLRIIGWDDRNGTWSEDRLANSLNNGYDKLAHEVNITGCSIMLDYTAPLIQNGCEYASVNIDNTQLNVKTLCTTNKGAINIGENVTSGVPLTGVNFESGVKEVNTGNAQAPYGYDSYYATVTWSDGTTELWADGSYPANAACKYDKVCRVEGGQSYLFEAAEGFSLKMSANLTLEADLKFNVYIPTTENITAVTVAGVAFDVASAEVVTVKGTECYRFQYTVAPYFAAGAFSIVVTTPEYTVAREMDLVEYANLVLAAYADKPEACNLTKAILQYVAVAHKYMGAYVDNYDATNNYDDADEVTMPTGGNDTMANLSAYFTSAQLNLDAAAKWRFNTVAGANLSDLVITVDGVAVDYVVGNGYVEVELPAYDMIKDITLSVGGVSGVYSFGAYYAAQAALNTLSPSTNNWRNTSGDLAKGQAYYLFDSGILDAFYTYAFYANAYKA